MRVAYIIPSLENPSGWRSHAVGFIRAMGGLVEPVLVVARRDRDEARRLFPGHALITLPATQHAYLRYIGTMPRFFASRLSIAAGSFPTVDLVHSLDAYPTGMIGHWLAAKLHRPHVVSALGTYGIAAAQSFFDRLAYTRVLTGASMLCPISQGTTDLIRSHFKEATTGVPIATILLGTDFPKTIPRAEALQHTPLSPPIILSVGSIKPRKGLHVSLEAFARVKQHIPSARYQLVGSLDEHQSGYIARLRQYVADHQLSGVEFLGALSDEALRQCYRDASVFLLTPQQVGLAFEGFGLVYLEAGAYGLPVIGTRTGGVADAVRDHETGFLADPGDVEGIAQALLRLLSDPDLARRMGCANRAWAEALTWKKCAERYLTVYQALTGTQPAGTGNTGPAHATVSSK